MKTDDRDIDSSNPSKNFKVGDFDHLSGFFTPVWESKRRVRSESPSPAAVAARSDAAPDSPAPDSAAPDADAPVPERAAPPRAERSAAALEHQRSMRASAAATVVHERLKTKLSEAGTPPDLDSVPESARGVVGPVASPNDELCPPHVLRRLRRTLRLSTPLPASVRAFVAQRQRN